MSIREEPTGADPARLSAFSLPLSCDPQATRRRVLAVAAAFMIHAAAIALVLVRLQAAKPLFTSPSITVELVTPAAVQSAARASAAPRFSPPTDAVRESGGRSDRTPGDATPAPPSATEAPTDAAKAPPSVVRQEKAYDPLLQAPKSSFPAKNIVPRSSLRQDAADNPKPLLRRSPAGRRAKYASNSSGGGDRYLNALRDRILRHRIHPAVAAPALVSDTARYEIVMNRRGRLLHARILQSSGDARLDDAGLKTIERTAPFGRVPADIAGDPVALVLILRMAP